MSEAPDTSGGTSRFPQTPSPGPLRGQAASRPLSRARLSVLAAESVGPYRLLRLGRGGLDAGTPGQFFMLEAPGRPLPRPMSVCAAPRGELWFLLDPIGPGTRALARLGRGDAAGVLGPLGNGFRLDVERPLLVGGGIGMAPFPYLSQALRRPPAVLGFRSGWHAEAASLVPNAEVVLEPTLVTEVMPAGHDVLACGPEPMLAAVGTLAPRAQLAWEAPMACGYGACYGCVVDVGGGLKRLCIDGPVLHGGIPGSPVSPLLGGRDKTTRSWPPAGQSPAPAAGAGEPRATSR